LAKKNKGLTSPGHSRRGQREREAKKGSKRQEMGSGIRREEKNRLERGEQNPEHLDDIGRCKTTPAQRGKRKSGGRHFELTEPIIERENPRSMTIPIIINSIEAGKMSTPENNLRK